MFFMNYNLLKDIIDLAGDFEKSRKAVGKEADSVEGFKSWIAENFIPIQAKAEPDWEGKENGRSPEGVICTMIVSMNRYAKMYSRAIISDTDFSTQEDFIYLINLRVHGRMSKMELIKMNLQDKPTGMQIIARLLSRGWIRQDLSPTDRRSKNISITDYGIKILEKQMPKIRNASKIVSGNLTFSEKMELIRILSKLEDFHNPIFNRNIAPSKLLAALNIQ